MKFKSNLTELKKILDELSIDFNYSERIKNDPVSFVRKFPDPADREVAALISSCFAYGGVKTILNSLDKIFHLAGSSPAHFVLEAGIDDYKRFDGFYHRFHNQDDLKTLLWGCGQILKKWKSLNHLFLDGYKKSSFAGGLENFSTAFLEQSEKSPFEGTRSFPHFFPLPSRKSPCKRLCLMTRWLCREDQVDPGGWRGVKRADLIIPLDTHIARIGRYLELTTRKSPSWNMAVEITRSLKKMDPDDPLQYDFILCHMGISGQCPSSVDRTRCINCPLKKVCVLEPVKTQP